MTAIKAPFKLNYGGGGGLVDLTSWQLLSIFTQSGNTLTSPIITGSNAAAVSTGKIPAGTAFVVQFDIGLNEDAARLGISTLNTADSESGLITSMFGSFSSGTGHFVATISGTFYNDPTFSTAVTSIIRTRGDGSLIYIETSVDGGSTWSLITNGGTPMTPFTQPAVDMWVQAIADNTGSITTITNIKTTALS